MTEERKKVLNREYEKAKTDPELMEKYKAKRRQRRVNRSVNALSEIGIDHNKIGTSICASKTCTTVLSKYNPSFVCAKHEGKVIASGIEDTLRKNHTFYILKKELPKLELV